MKKILQYSLLSLAVVLHVVGIMFLLTASKIAPIGPIASFLNDDMNVILQYVIVIGTMATSIMMFSITSGTLPGKLGKNLTIGITVWSTILTVPLLYVFIALTVDVFTGTRMPLWEILIGDVAGDKGFTAFLKTAGIQKTIYILGILMSIIFLAVPIVSAIGTVKKKNLEI